jgi:hypothetical protein
MTIEITVDKRFNCTRVTGYVNGREIIAVSDNVSKEFTIGTSSCLPTKFDDAQEYLDCMQQTLDKAKEIRETIE